MKARVPTFVLPKRRYELNEDMWIVKFAKPKIELAVEIEWLALSVMWHLAFAFTSFFFTEVRSSGPIWRTAGSAVAHGIGGGFRNVGAVWRSAVRGVARQGSNIVLFFQWGRVPKDWERMFVSKIRESESLGVSFHEIVKTTLPSIIGEAPAFVLLRWVGEKGAKGPRQFVKAVEKTFGKSAKSIIIGLNSSLDPVAMLDVPEQPEEKFRAVIEAIQRADDDKLAEADHQEEAVQLN